MVIKYLRRPYVYVVFLGLLAALVIVDRYFPEYRQLFCEAMQPTSESVKAFCSPHYGPTAVPILLVVATTLTVAALALLPVPDKGDDIRDQANKARTLENPAEPD